MKETSFPLVKEQKNQKSFCKKNILLAACSHHGPVTKTDASTVFNCDTEM